MDALEYIKERVEDQINWYDTKSKWNQRGYKIARVVEIVCAVSIPFIMGYISDATPALKFVAGLLGVIVAVIAGLVSLYQFQENWINYRTTCESLRHEKYLFLTKSKPYDSGDTLDMLVERVESLISKENTNWAQLMRTSKEKK